MCSHPTPPFFFFFFVILILIFFFHWPRYFALGNIAASKHAFNQALSIYPANKHCLVNRSVLERTTGARSKAVADYRLLLTIASRYPLSPAQRAVHRILSQLSRLLMQDPISFWARIPPLRGALGVAVELCNAPSKVLSENEAEFRVKRGEVRGTANELLDRLLEKENNNLKEVPYSFRSHLLTNSLTCSLTRSVARPLNQSINQSPTHSIIQSINQSINQ